jgi:hypothetical protein
MATKARGRGWRRTRARTTSRERSLQPTCRESIFGFTMVLVTGLAFSRVES